MRSESGQVFHLKDYRPTDFVIDTVSLNFDLSPTATHVESTLTVRRRPGTAKDAPLVLDGDDLTFKGLSIDGEPASKQRFEATPDALTIHDLPEADVFTLTIETEVDPSANSKLMGLYRSNGVYCTQCEAEGFRRITYFLDRPDVLAVYTVRIEADAGTPLLLSNGNPGETGELQDGRHFAMWHDPHPKPSYLFALVAGDLGVVKDSFTTMSGRRVELRIFVEHGKEKRATYAMDALKRSMGWDEDVFGREYDLDIFQIVAVSDFNMGAMENKGLNVFNDKYVLADPETATDQDFANIEAIIAHEYFHNWTGNRITCRDWFQLCLKEGLTVFRDHEFSADQRSRPVKRISEVRLLKAHQFPEDAGPLAHPPRPVVYSEINNFYTATVYEKGSEVVRMIATILGPDGFRKGMDLYFKRHDGEAATIEDFIRAFEDATHTDLRQFALWYHQAGTPVVSVSVEHDAKAERFVVELEQSVPATPGETRKQPLHIPLSFALIAPDGQILSPGTVDGARVNGDVLHLTDRRHRVTFEGVGERPVLSLNRSFSAPINLNFDQPRADLAHIARHDADDFARWNALNTYALELLIEATAAERDGGASRVDETYLEAVLDVARNESLEPAFRAQALVLPSEADIAREIGNDIDPDAIHRARETVLKALGRKGHADFARLYEAMESEGPFKPDAESAGRRALRSVALGLLGHAEGTPDRALAAFERADNMTELSNALMLLCHQNGGSEAEASALKTFEQRFADNPLVIDKWLTVQATAPGDDTLDRVRHLMGTSYFALSNPNRVRALIGAFAAGNPTGFNRADGAGFTFLAEQVIALDGRNPQVAARLLTAMRSWRALEAGRRTHAEAALRSIAERKTLSRDVRDIVERTLG